MPNGAGTLLPEHCERKKIFELVTLATESHIFKAIDRRMATGLLGQTLVSCGLPLAMTFGRGVPDSPTQLRFPHGAKLSAIRGVAPVTAAWKFFGTDTAPGREERP